MKIQSLKADVIKQLRSDLAFTNVAHCVEELVWNSIDAGANCIAVRLNLHFLKIQVIDNGSGILFDQMDMVGERYATSKCHTLDDLKCLQYVGFRGEVLASLKEVSSKLLIESRTAGSFETYCRIFNHGKALRPFISIIPRPSQGTTVTVFDFMHNMPVRRNTISEAIDLEETCKLLQSVALIHPNISFSLQNEATGLICLKFKKCISVASAFLQLFGKKMANKLQAMEDKLEDYKIDGYIIRASFLSKDYQFLYVNKRLILRTCLHKLINEILNKVLSTKFQCQLVSPTKNQALFCGFILNISCPRNKYDLIFDCKKTLIEFSEWEKVQKLVIKVIISFLKAADIVCIPDEMVVQTLDTETCMLSSNVLFPNLGLDNFKNSLFSNTVRRSENPFTQKMRDPFNQISNLRRKTGPHYEDTLQNAISVHKNVICLQKITESYSILDSLKGINTTSCLKNCIMPVTIATTSLSMKKDMQCQYTFPTQNPVRLKNLNEIKPSKFENKKCKSFAKLKEQYMFHSQKNKKLSSLHKCLKKFNRPYRNVSKSIRNAKLITRTIELTDCQNQFEPYHKSKSNPIIITREKLFKSPSLNSYNDNSGTTKYSFCKESCLSDMKNMCLCKKEESKMHKTVKSSNLMEKLQIKFVDSMAPSQDAYKFDESAAEQDKYQKYVRGNYHNQNIFNEKSCIDLAYQLEIENHKISSNGKDSTHDSYLSRANPSELVFPFFTASKKEKNQQLSSYKKDKVIRRGRFLNLHKISSLPMDVVESSTHIIAPCTFSSERTSKLIKKSKWKKEFFSSNTSAVKSRTKKKAKNKMSLCHQYINTYKRPFWLPEMIEVWKADQNFILDDVYSTIFPSPKIEVVKNIISLTLEECSPINLFPTFSQGHCFNKYDASCCIKYDNKHIMSGSNSCKVLSVPELLCSESQIVQPSDLAFLSNSSICSITYEDDFILRSTEREEKKFFKSLSVTEERGHINLSILTEDDSNFSCIQSSTSNNCKTNPSYNKQRQSSELQLLSKYSCGTKPENYVNIGKGNIENGPTALLSKKLKNNDKILDKVCTLSSMFKNENKNRNSNFNEEKIQVNKKSLHDVGLYHESKTKRSLFSASDILINEPPYLSVQDVSSPEMHWSVRSNIIKQVMQDTYQTRWISKVDEESKRAVYINSLTGNSTYADPTLLSHNDVASVLSDPEPFVAPRMTHFFLTHEFSPFLGDSNQFSLDNGDTRNLQSDLISHLGLTEAEDCHRKWRFPVFEKKNSDDVEAMFQKWKNPVFDVAPAVNSIDVRKVPVCYPQVHTLNSYRFNHSSLSQLEVIGQIDCKFICCIIQDFDGSKKDKKLLALLDQHAVHERICLEELSEDIYEVKRDGKRTIRSLKVTPPLTVPLNPEDLRLLRTYHTSLQDIGIYLTLRDDAPSAEVFRLPLCFVNKDTNQLQKQESNARNLVEKIIKEWLQSLMQSRSVPFTIPKTFSAFLNTQACRDALKFGDSLTLSECKQLLSSLAECRMPFQCAHGRPSVAPMLDLQKLGALSRKICPPSLWKLCKCKIRTVNSFN